MHGWTTVFRVLEESSRCMYVSAVPFTYLLPRFSETYIIEKAAVPQSDCRSAVPVDTVIGTLRAKNFRPRNHKLHNNCTAQLDCMYQIGLSLCVLTIRPVGRINDCCRVAIIIIIIIIIIISEIKKRGHAY